MRALTALFTLVLALLVSGSVLANGKTECDGCEAYKNPSSGKTSPANVPLVCLHFVQDAPDTVAVLIRHDSVREAEPVFAYSKRAGLAGMFCLGRQRFENALDAGGIVELCNGVAHSILREDEIKIVLELGRTPPHTAMCLFGDREACARIGNPLPPPARRGVLLPRPRPLSR